MNWPTWNQSAVAAVIAVVIAAVARRRARPGWESHIAPAATEFALIAGLYTVWRVARKLPLAQPDGAIERAHRIEDFERRIHLPSELTLQHWFLRHDTVAHLTNVYYATLHVPVLIGFLVWLYVRHRDQFPHWRNALAILTGFCLFIRFIRVAPPRFLPGYVDLATRYGMSLYGPVNKGISDQFAAMPSIHVGWAAVVSFGIVATSTSKWRWLALSYVTLTFIAVSATGNHWWLDGIVACFLLWLSLVIDNAVRRYHRSRGAATSGAAAEAPHGDQSESEDVRSST